jgi:hypothetical protein
MPTFLACALRRMRCLFGCTHAGVHIVRCRSGKVAEKKKGRGAVACTQVVAN